MAELSRMFLVFPIPGESHDVREARLQTYWDSIKDFPASAVEVGIARVCRGMYPQLNRAFAPSPAEFCEIVRGIQYRPVPLVPLGMLPEPPPSRSEQQRADHVRQMMGRRLASNLPKSSTLAAGTIVKWEQVDRFPVKQIGTPSAEGG